MSWVRASVYVMKGVLYQDSALHGHEDGHGDLPPLVTTDNCVNCKDSNLVLRKAVVCGHCLVTLSITSH